MNVRTGGFNAELTGLPAANSAHVDSEILPGGLSGQDLDDLQQLWTKVYKRPLTPAEVQEIYRTVKFLAETLI